MFRLAFFEVVDGINLLCSDKTGTLTPNFMTIVSKLPWCETLDQELLSFALLASEWTQCAKDVIDTMLFKSLKEVQAHLDRHTSHLLALRSCCQDDRIHCCGLLSQSYGIKADVDARVLSHVEGGIRYFGNASSDCWSETAFSPESRSRYLPFW